MPGYRAEITEANRPVRVPQRFVVANRPMGDRDHFPAGHIAVASICSHRVGAVEMQYVERFQHVDVVTAQFSIACGVAVRDLDRCPICDPIDGMLVDVQALVVPGTQLLDYLGVLDHAVQVRLQETYFAQGKGRLVAGDAIGAIVIIDAWHAAAFETPFRADAEVVMAGEHCGDAQFTACL